MFLFLFRTQHWIFHIFVMRNRKFNWFGLKAPSVQKNFCCFATTKRPIRYGYTTKDLLKLVKNSEADLYII